MSKAFVDMCLSGEALLEEIDDFVDKWHEADSGLPIHKFLGFTPTEYAMWVERPETLGYIILARRHSISLEEAIAQGESVAARTQSWGNAKALLEWLKKTGRIA